MLPLPPEGNEFDAQSSILKEQALVASTWKVSAREAGVGRSLGLTVQPNLMGEF